LGAIPGLKTCPEPCRSISQTAKTCTQKSHRRRGLEGKRAHLLKAQICPGKDHVDAAGVDRKRYILPGEAPGMILGSQQRP